MGSPLQSGPSWPQLLFPPGAQSWAESFGSLLSLPFPHSLSTSIPCWLCSSRSVCRDPASSLAFWLPSSSCTPCLCSVAAWVPLSAPGPKPSCAERAESQPALAVDCTQSIDLLPATCHPPHLCPEDPPSLVGLATSYAYITTWPLGYPCLPFCYFQKTTNLPAPSFWAPYPLGRLCRHLCILSGQSCPQQS